MPSIYCRSHSLSQQYQVCCRFFIITSWSNHDRKSFFQLLKHLSLNLAQTHRTGPQIQNNDGDINDNNSQYFLMCIYANTCVCYGMCICVHVYSPCMYVWRPETDIECIPFSLSIYFETGSHTEPGPHQFGQIGLKKTPGIFAPSFLGYGVIITWYHVMLMLETEPQSIFFKSVTLESGPFSSGRPHIQEYIGMTNCFL